MQNFSVSGVRKYFLIFIFMVPGLFVQNSWGMEGMIVKGLIGEGLAEAEARGIAGEIIGESIGRVGLSELSEEGLSNAVREALQENVGATFKKLGPLLKELGETQNIAKFTEEAKGLFAGEQKSFVESISKNILTKEGSSLTAFDRSLLEKGGIEKVALEKIPLKSSALAEGAKVEIKIVPKQMEEVESALEQLDSFKVKQNDLTDARISGDRTRIEAAQTEEANAGQAMQKNQSARAQQADQDVKEAVAEQKKAETPEQKADANEKVKKTEEAQKEQERVTYKQEYDAAENKYKNSKVVRDNAKEELNKAKQVQNEIEKDPKSTAEQKAAAKEVVDNKQVAYEKAKEDVGIAKTELTKRENELLEKSDLFENKWMKTKNNVVKSAKWFGTKGGGFVGWVGEQLGMALVFGLPQMVIDSYNSVKQKEEFLKTLKEVRPYGKIYLKIAGFWINEEEPANSFFVYIGIPTNDPNFPITDEFLKTANFYVAKTNPQFAPWGTVAITAQPVEAMVHLNTGYIFDSNGQPENDSYLTWPLKDVDKLDNQHGIETSLNDNIKALAGDAGSGAGKRVEGVKFYVDEYTAEYKGNKTVGALFSEPEHEAGHGGKPIDPERQYVLLLMPVVNALQQGTPFKDAKGKPLYMVQGFKGFRTSTDNAQDIMALLVGGEHTSDSVPPAAEDKNYVVARNYIYQSKDTPIVKLVKDQIAADDPNKEKLLEILVDYVVVLDDDNNIVPLQVPQPIITTKESESAFAVYDLNPRATKIKSILDTGNNAYYSVGGAKTTYVGTLKELKEKLNNFPEYAQMENQIDAMGIYFDKNIKYGPFKFNGVTLTIDKALADAGIYVYKAAGMLEGGFDDYLIAGIPDSTGKSLEAGSLPSAGISYFVSLVTSRFYDKNMQPYAPPVKNSVKDYYIAKEGKVKTGKPSDSSLPQAKAPLYTLFVEGAYNPSEKPAGYTKPLPIEPYWALNVSPQFSLQGKNPMGTYFTENASNTLASTLLKAIQDSHDKWVTVLDVSDPGALSKRMGPFVFAQATEPVMIRAISPAAIEHDYFIYTSDRYPDEYLVLSEDENGTSNVGGEFGSQRYAVSISTGSVYDAQKNGDPVKTIAIDGIVKRLELTQAGVDARVAKLLKTLNQQKAKTKDQNKVNVINGLIAAEDTQKAALYDLVTKIQGSQAIYNRNLMNKLYGPNVTFAGRQLYLSKESYLAGQYIYGDVTDVGNPLDDKGNEKPEVVQKINDYYVTYDETVDDDGKSTSVIRNTPLGKDTALIVSLVTGAGLNRGGTFSKAWPTINLSTKGGQTKASDLMGFVGDIKELIQSLSGKPVVLWNRIEPLVKAAYENIQKELKAIEEEKKNSPAGYPTQANLSATLFSDSLPYVQQSPAILPRYLKQNANRYYMVTPDLSETQANKNIQQVRSFIDYDIGTEHVGENALGMVYDQTGKPIEILRGWALESVRAYAGLLIDASGSQQLGIGVDHPTLPVTPITLKNGKKMDVMIKTPLASVKDGNATIDFYYNTQIDNYFANIKTDQSQYYVDLAAGYGYNLDGTPRWYEAPVFKNAATGDILLVGTDDFGLKKVAYKKAGESRYRIYNQMVSFGDIGSYTADDATIRHYINTTGYISFSDMKPQTNGSYFTLLSDSFGEQGKAVVSTDDKKSTLSELRLGYAYLDINNNLLTQPYYIVWDQTQVENPNFISYDSSKPVSDTNKPENELNPKYIVRTKLVGQFMPDSTSKFSMLAYAQTRNAGSTQGGTFVEDDFYDYPVPADPTQPRDKTIKSQKLVGIMYTPGTASLQYKPVMQQIFYKNQRCTLTKQSDTTYSTSYKDEKGASKSITVKLEQVGPKGSSLVARWLSITDGGKILDYMHESMVWDTTPLPKGVADPTNLNYKKLTKWLVNVTSFIPNLILQRNFPGIHANALATPLRLIGTKPSYASMQKASGSKCKTSIPDSLSAMIEQQVVPALSLDSKGKVYLPRNPEDKTVQDATIQRYVYKFGSNQLEKTQDFYDEFLDGFYVDLSNGILYEQLDTVIFPTGSSFVKLAELLAFLHVAVVLDENGNPKALAIADCAAPEQAALNIKAAKTAAVRRPLPRAAAPRRATAQKQPSKR